MRPRTRLAATLCVLVGLLSACATTGTLQPFSTDGCSLFPDRSLLSDADWCTCCVAHDLAYWRGGTAEERRTADQALATCVRQATGSQALADLMHAGVRAGGHAGLGTPFRWGYGWPRGRSEGPLSQAEAAQADALERAHRLAHPVLACPVAPGR